MVWIFIALMIYRLAKKSEMDFLHPVWAMILLFGLYAALGMPRFYALGFAIPERNINLIYFSYYSVMLCAMFYLFGWFSHHFSDKLSNCKIGVLYEKRFGTVFTAFCLLFALAYGGQIIVSKSTGEGLALERMPAGLSAVYSLVGRLVKRKYFMRRCSNVRRSVAMRRARMWCCPRGQPNLGCSHTRILQLTQQIGKIQEWQGITAMPVCGWKAKKH